MDPKLLTENGWKSLALRFRIKDNRLQDALWAYEQVDEEHYDTRLKMVAGLSHLAWVLKNTKEVGGIRPVGRYLDDLVSAADAKHRELSNTKAVAEQEAEEEEEEGEYHERLLASFRKLKSEKDLCYEFIVCDAKPHCGLMLAKRITARHKNELSRVTGGSKRFPYSGTCQEENGRFTFTMEKPVAGLARKLRDSIKQFTGKKLPIVVGTEVAEDDPAQQTVGDAEDEVDAGGLADSAGVAGRAVASGTDKPSGAPGKGGGIKGKPGKVGNILYDTGKYLISIPPSPAGKFPLVLLFGGTTGKDPVIKGTPDTYFQKAILVFADSDGTFSTADALLKRLLPETKTEIDSSFISICGYSLGGQAAYRDYGQATKTVGLIDPTTYYKDLKNLDSKAVLSCNPPIWKYWQGKLFLAGHPDKAKSSSYTVEDAQNDAVAIVAKAGGTSETTATPHGNYPNYFLKTFQSNLI